MLQKIAWEVRCRIMGKGKFKGNVENVAVCNNWGISHHIVLESAAVLYISWSLYRLIGLFV